MASDPLASSSQSSSLASAGSDDESFINEVDGLPYVFLATIVETIDRAGKKRQLELTRHGGSRHGKHRNRNLKNELEYCMHRLGLRCIDPNLFDAHQYTSVNDFK
jgi:hypothetical protein